MVVQFEILGSREVQASRRHYGVLGVGASYTESFSFRVPHAIWGNYFIIIVTDAFDEVFENTMERDNTNFTQVRLQTG